jgi:RNA polymerase sigma-70 factor (ECF subfamily)
MGRGELEKLMEEHNRLLWSVAGGILRGVGTNEDIEECVGDVWIALWRDPGAFDERRGTLPSYLAVMTRSRALDKLRALRRRETAALQDDTPADGGVEDEMVRRELFGSLRDAVDALDEPAREIVIRRYFFEEKPSEIAAKLSLPVKEVHNRLYAAKGRLRKALTEEM